MSTLDDLLNAIFGGLNATFEANFAGWVRDSRRFRAFAGEYRVKIRNKLKNVRDEHGQNDLRAELETAALLLREDRFTLEYEKYAASKQRGPDFTVTFRTHTLFNVEVRRMRGLEPDGAANHLPTVRLMQALCDKIGQMPPGIVNVLWLVSEGGLSEADIARVAAALRQSAERKDEDFFARRGFESAAKFLRHYSQLSGIVLRQPDENCLWLNPLARHKTPPDIAAAIRRLVLQ